MSIPPYVKGTQGGSYKGEPNRDQQFHRQQF
jgi:hypothetical protein